MKETMPTSSNFHTEYLEVTQHWHNLSEKYAGGDALLTRLYDGWEICETVWREDHWFAGMRAVTIYHFEIKRGDDREILPVVNNPYVNRLIVRAPRLQVQDIVERDTHREESSANQ